MMVQDLAVNLGYFTSTSPSGLSGSNATAVAFTTSRANVTSVEKILLTNAGFGYTEVPTITISGGGGTGAAMTVQLTQHQME